jgi:integrase
MSDINLDPVEEHLNARNLFALVDRWLAALSCSPLTRRTYAANIAHFTRWWKVVGPTVEWRLTQTLLEDFEVHLRSVLGVHIGEPLTYTTRRTIVSIVRMMFVWAFEKNKVPRDYSKWLPWPPGAQPPRKPVTVEHLERLMLAAAQSPKPLRDQTLIAFFIGTGARVGEVTGLKVEDLTILADGSGVARVTGKRTKANKTGIHDIAFPASAGKWLVRYMDEAGIQSGPLWPNGRGRPMTAQGIYLAVRRAIEDAKLYNDIRGCHDLRRAFATILGKMYPGSPAWHDMIRRQLGHASYSMTAHYTNIGVDDIRDRIISPLGNSESAKWSTGAEVTHGT